MKKIVFDIETAPPKEKSEAYLDAWEYCNKEEGTEGLYPEFSRIVCISAICNINGAASFYDEDEKTLLEVFLSFVGTGPVTWVGHNIKAFDIPFLQARLMANGLGLPYALKTYGKKPWDLEIHDTKEMWKGGFFKTSQAASLTAICLALGIPTPKDAISGKDVAAYYHAGRIGEIVEYCEKDTAATLEVYKTISKYAI